LVVKKGSKTRSRRASSIPLPVSAMAALGGRVPLQDPPLEVADHVPERHALHLEAEPLHRLAQGQPAPGVQHRDGGLLGHGLQRLELLL
jgi:hypothetical protein